MHCHQTYIVELLYYTMLNIRALYSHCVVLTVAACVCTGLLIHYWVVLQVLFESCNVILPSSPFPLSSSLRSPPPFSEGVGVVPLCWWYATCLTMHTLLRTLSCGPTPMNVWLHSGGTSCRGACVYTLNHPCMVLATSYINVTILHEFQMLEISDQFSFLYPTQMTLTLFKFKPPPLLQWLCA